MHAEWIPYVRAASPKKSPESARVGGLSKWMSPDPLWRLRAPIKVATCPFYAW